MSDPSEYIKLFRSFFHSWPHCYLFISPMETLVLCNFFPHFMSVHILMSFKYQQKTLLCNCHRYFITCLTMIVKSVGYLLSLKPYFCFLSFKFMILLYSLPKSNLKCTPQERNNVHVGVILTGQSAAGATPSRWLRSYRNPRNVWLMVIWDALTGLARYRKTVDF